MAPGGPWGQSTGSLADLAKTAPLLVQVFQAWLPSKWKPVPPSVIGKHFRLVCVPFSDYSGLTQINLGPD